MTFCPNCGAPVEGKFCGACGKAVGDAPVTTTGAAAAGMEDNLAGALAYLLGFITGIVFLVLEPYNRNREVRFHAFQSIFFSVALLGIYIVLMILSAVLGTVIPILGAVLIGVVSLVVWLGSLVLWLLMMIKTYNRRKIVLPVIGPLAAKQAG